MMEQWVADATKKMIDAWKVPCPPELILGMSVAMFHCVVTMGLMIICLLSGVCVGYGLGLDERRERGKNDI